MSVHLFKGDGCDDKIVEDSSTEGSCDTDTIEGFTWTNSKFNWRTTAKLVVRTGDRFCSGMTGEDSPADSSTEVP